MKRDPNIDAAGWPDDSFSADLGHGNELVDAGDTAEETRPLGNHEMPELSGRLGKRTGDVTVLREGTQLQQGSTYLDLRRIADGPFTAMAGDRVGRDQIIVSKRLIEYELWNELVGRPAPGSDASE